MANGSGGAWRGKARFLRDFSLESSREAKKWGDTQRTAEKARETETDRKNLWSILGTVLAVPFLGPAAPLAGAIIGNIAKGIGTVDDKSVESHKMDTSDVGRWNQASDLEMLKSINREFEAYDKGEFWKGMVDIGEAAAFTYSAGGGVSIKEGFTPSNFDPTKWGGKGGQTTKEVIENFFSKTDEIAATSGVGVSPTFGEGPGMTIQPPSIDPSSYSAVDIPSFAPTPFTPKDEARRELLNLIGEFDEPRDLETMMQNFLFGLETSKTRFYK